MQRLHDGISDKICRCPLKIVIKFSFISRILERALIDKLLRELLKKPLFQCYWSNETVAILLSVRIHIIP